MSATFFPAAAIGRNSKQFHEAAETNPCDGCPAPCCRIVLTPHPAPTSFMDLDYIRYLLGFPSITMLLNKDGSWQQAFEQACSLLDLSSNRCTVHGTPRKPKTCVYFNPYRCWYKQAFVTGDAEDVVRIDQAGLDAILAHVGFHDNGDIVVVPTWESVRDLVARARASTMSDARASADGSSPS
jgi:Fe-S-cluster containining protein